MTTQNINSDHLGSHFGRRSLELALADGARAVIALQGAQVISWKTADGIEQLYLSPLAASEASKPIRGGVPVCFPQFNQRRLGPSELPKHGFARTQDWSVDSIRTSNETSVAELRLNQQNLPPTLRKLWDHEFSVLMQVTLAVNQLTLRFRVQNTGTELWPFSVALHTYLRVSDIARTQLRGLGATRYWDAVKDLADPGISRMQNTDDLTFSAETDRVYKNPARQLKLTDEQRTLQIEQSDSFTETVVWNPGQDLAAQLTDMPADGYRQMLCVEAAKIDAAIRLAPGEHWEGFQRLSIDS